MMSRGMLRLLAMVVVGFLFGGNAWADGGFSAGELAALRRGGLVSRPLRNARSDQVGGTAWILVNADVDTVWRAITDFSSYRRFVPAAQRSRTLQRNGDVRVVSMRQESGLISVDYALRFVTDSDKREVRFRIDHRRPHEVRDGWGFFRAEARRDGRTLVSSGAVIEPGSSLLAAVVGDVLRDRVLSIPRRLKRWVEGPGRPRYARTPGRRIAGGASTAPGDRHP